MKWMDCLKHHIHACSERVLGRMPTRQPVTFEMVTKWNIIFKQIQQDLNKCTCISALISFITYLYEVSIVTMTFKHSPGKIASYREVSKCLPCTNNISMLVMLRNKLIHELYDVDNVIAFIKDGITDFGKENCDFLSEQCFNWEIDVWYEFQKAFLKIGDYHLNSPEKMSF